MGISNQLISAENDISYDTPRLSNDVRIGPQGLDMPLGYIFLIRKGSVYGAVKFTRYWKGWIKYSDYTKYDCWFQGDGTGDFKKNNVIYQNKIASSILLGIGRFSFNIGKDEICFGPFKLWWYGPKGTVLFFGVSQDPSDYGIELSPTKWKDIKEINVFDSRLRWYRFNESRPRQDIPVNKLW